MYQEALNKLKYSFYFVISLIQLFSSETNVLMKSGEKKKKKNYFLMSLLYRIPEHLNPSKRTIYMF